MFDNSRVVNLFGPIGELPEAVQVILFATIEAYLLAGYFLEEAFPLALSRVLRIPLTVYTMLHAIFEELV